MLLLERRSRSERVRLNQDSIWAIVAGILLTIVFALVFEELFFPRDLGMTMIPSGAFALFLWLNAYRTSRKKKTVSSINPSI